jgi:hypothetical protein
LTAQESLAALPDARRAEPMAKLLLSLRDEALRTIVYEAESRGISVQELLRAVIIPEWVRDNNVRSPVQVILNPSPTRDQVFHRSNRSTVWNLDGK